MEPKYNAISYTWGRWQLKDGEKPHVKALDVKGTPWEIPRIDPGKHFSVEQFRQVVLRATDSEHLLEVNEIEVSKSVGFLPPPADTRKQLDKVDFIWLDVACIDQRFGSNSMEELGRQAKIFKGARSVYIWLSSQKVVELQTLLGELGKLVEKLNCLSGSHHLLRSVEKSWQDAAFRILQALLQDPWFTSLWTLQEAFLCPHAIFLSQEAQTVMLELAQTSPATLKSLLLHCEILNQVSVQSIAAKFNSPRDWRLTSLMRMAGLSALAMNSPMALYSIARFRKATYELDQVYGIMQVFDLQLGKAAKEADPDQEFTLQELEDQLGAALLKHFPILSQLHTFIEPADFGKGWRIGRSSAIPELVKEIPCFGVMKTANHKSLCELTTTYFRGSQWGYVRGKACSFESLQLAWAQADQQPFAQTLQGRTIQNIALDLGDVFGPDCPEYAAVNIPRNGRQHRLASWMAEHFQEKLRTIILAHCSQADDCHDDGQSYIIGLIVIRQTRDDITYWHRIGICVWYLTHTMNGIGAPEESFLAGRHDAWQLLEGLYG
jgi:hypothetical protein